MLVACILSSGNVTIQAAGQAAIQFLRPSYCYPKLNLRIVSNFAGDLRTEGDIKQKTGRRADVQSSTVLEPSIWLA
jgi:hypothetical protein